ncbi:hypothetical protein V490_05680 [Pseudogymnoascus sp. VKM F-3557]|nr:hypothetical protein V490_05680 [Pseudogymnoascus sp. VKM F-3557]
MEVNSKVDGKGLATKVEWIDESEELTSTDDKGAFPRFSVDVTNMSIRHSTVKGSSQPQNKAASTRSLIRSQARRFSGRQRKTESWVHRREEKVGNALEGHPRRVIAPRDSQIQESLLDGAITDAIDPFSSLSISKSRHANNLLHHYDSVFIHSNMAVNPKKKWLGYAITDPALLHATLIHSALHISLLTNTAPSSDVFLHNGMAIRSINQRLGDTIISDTMIAAISCLAHMENLNGLPESSKIHMDGLELLVKRKGGLDALGMSGLCRRVVLWVDLCTSVVCETKPRFEPSERIEAFKLSTREDSSEALRQISPQNDYLEQFESYTYTDSMVNILNNIKGLEKLIEEVREDDTQAMDSIFYSDIVEAVERRCVMLLQTERIAVGQDPKYTAFVKAFAYTALIHIYSVNHDLPISLKIFGILSQRLRLELENADIQLLEARVPRVMLWALLMGGVGASDEENRGWSKPGVSGAITTFVVEILRPVSDASDMDYGVTNAGYISCEEASKNDSSRISHYF